jgi:tetratricopeptide (TPR) repeat protein/TolB-like protein
MDAVLHKQPIPPGKLNPELPAELEEIIDRAMEKDRELRYQSAAELRSELALLTQEIGSGAVNVARSTGVRTSAARPSAGWAAWRFKASRRPAWLLAGAVVLLSAIGLGIFEAIKLRSAPQPPPEHAVVKPRRSIAVLGFRNLSGSPDQEWISTALSEMLDTELASGNELRVISGESVGRMKLDLSLPVTDSYAPETLSKIRRNLGADEVVVGSYLVMGKGGQGSLRIDLRVQDVKGGDTVAAVSESGSETELAEVVSRGSATLREKLGIGILSADELHSVNTSLPGNPQAVRLYSEGLAKLRAFDPKSARELFQKAVAADPNHALSHSFLAKSFFSLGYEAQAKVEAGKAFDLSQTLPRRDRLLVEGNYREMQHDYPAAIEAYRTLWEFFPEDIDGGLRLASVQTAAGKGKDALVTVAQMRGLAEPSNHDPRIDVAEAAARESQGDFRGAQQAASVGADVASRQGSRLIMAEAKRHEAWDWDRLGQIDKATAEFAEVRDLSLNNGDPMVAAAALNGIGAAYYDKGDFESSRKAYEEGLAIVRRVGAQRSVAIITSNLGNIFFERGQMEEARRHYQEALDIDRVLDSPGVASDLGSLANVMQSTGDLAGAVKLQEQSLAGFRKTGDRRGESATLVNLGDVLWDQGQLAAAKAQYEESIAVDQQTGFRRDLGFAWFGISEILRAQDRLTEARAKTEEAIALRKELSDATDLAYSQVQLAEISMEQGNTSEAAKLTRDAAAAFAKQDMYDAGCQAQAVLSSALLAQASIREAQAAAMRAADLCRQGSDRTARFRAQFAHAALRMQAGKFNEADEILETVRGEASRYGYAVYNLESRLRLGELELKSGKQAAGRDHLTQLQSDAKAQGFALIVRKAAQDLKSH